MSVLLRRDLLMISYQLLLFANHQLNFVKTKATISSTGTSNFKLLLQLYPELKCYKDPFECPVGVTIKQKGTDIFKKVELDGKEWSSPEYAQGQRTGLKKNTNGPDKMFLYAKCTVLIPNTDSSLLDEGRMSEYKDPFGVLARLGEDKYLKFNRIPEVLVMDHDKKDEIIITPQAYKHNKPLSCDFWLVSIKVLGKKHQSLALSPSKAAQKRKSVFLSDAQSTAKRLKLT
ncbi:hypothetical protein K435DRAFT_798506 [Dendrothele bispora CBS 962.96]|uniref:Uncharacterized protein n=1 Tax=Dendrothele bispora (strain CBS 962.96) TaxID=1314807 RepID=A0A4V4HFI0_DENBC|nr:hypothetical protein K435DRAFT_798506 [Dendrothele bispora CBS 962.96]